MSDLNHPERTIPGAAETPRSVADEVKRTAQHAKETTVADVREGIARGTARIKDEATARTEGAKQSLAQEMSATADALGSAAREMEGHSLQRGLLSEAAEGLTSMSQAIEGKSIGDIVSELAAFGRRNPAMFLGGATLAGFALSRLAQASARSGESGAAQGKAGADRRFEQPGFADAGGVGAADAGTVGEPRPVGAGEPLGGGMP